MSDTDASEKSSSCPRCGRALVCGMVAGRDSCWCAALPPALALPTAPGAGCYCPECLRELIAEQSAAR